MEMEHIENIPQDLPQSSLSNRGSSPSGKHSKCSSSKHKNDEISCTNRPEHVKKLVISMLKGQRFVGKYQQTRFVDSLQEYREIIEVEERDPIIAIVADLRKRLLVAFPRCWIGFTPPKSSSAPYIDGNCFWTTNENKIYVNHYIRIRDIEFRANEVLFKIEIEDRVLREQKINEINLDKVLAHIKQSLQEFSFAAWQLLTIENIKNMFAFIAMLILAIGTFSFHAGNWLLQLMREVSNLISSSTPIIIKILDIVQKIVGACFILLATIWRDLFGANKRHNPELNYRGNAHSDRYLTFQ